MADLRMVPVGVLLELVDRLDATAATKDSSGLGRSGAFHASAEALRDTVAHHHREPVGYMVAGPDVSGHVTADWDGEVHPDLDTGGAALAECRREGWTTWSLYALTEVPDA